MLCLLNRGHVPPKHYILQYAYCCSHLTSDATILLWYLFYPLRFLCFLAHPPTIFCWTRNVVLLRWHQFTWSIQGITIQKILISYTFQITRFYQSLTYSRTLNSVGEKRTLWLQTLNSEHMSILTHCGRVRQICVFNTVKLGTSASSP